MDAEEPMPWEKTQIAGYPILLIGIAAAVFTVYLDAIYINNQLFKICDYCGFDSSALDLQWLIYDDDCWNSTARHDGYVQMFFDNTVWIILIVCHALIVLMIVSNYKLITTEEPTYYFMRVWVAIHITVTFLVAWAMEFTFKHLLKGYLECIMEEKTIKRITLFTLVTQTSFMVDLGYVLMVTFKVKRAQNEAKKQSSRSMKIKK